MLNLLLAMSLLNYDQLGKVTIVKGNAAIIRAAKTQGNGTSLLPGRQKKLIAINVGDKIVVRSGYVKGDYDGYLLVVGPERPFLAPKRGVYAGTPLPRVLLGQTHMGSDGDRSPVMAFWPAQKQNKPLVYVDSNGVFSMGWTSAASVKTVTVSVLADGQELPTVTVPAQRTVDGVSSFGWIEDKKIGLALRKLSKEDDVLPLRITLTSDNRKSVVANCFLASERTMRRWDGLVKDLDLALLGAKDSGCDDWYEALAQLLENVGDDCPMLTWYWILRTWVMNPNMYLMNDAMRSLAEQDKRVKLSKQFAKRCGE